jgi:hypothetical protein
MKNVDRMGVIMIMSHLIITLAILGIYLYSLHSGIPDETLKTILTVIVGYWFGQFGIDKMRGGSSTQINQANEVKIEAEKKEEIQ